MSFIKLTQGLTGNLDEIWYFPVFEFSSGCCLVLRRESDLERQVLGEEGFQSGDNC